MANSGNGGVFDLGELHNLIDELGSVSGEEREALLAAMAGENEECDCGECESEVLSFPPVELAPTAELAEAVLSVPLVRDARRLAEWTGIRRVTPEGFLWPADAHEAAALLGVDDERLRLVWIVAVNTGLLRITQTGAAPGPALPGDLMEFWDGVVMDVLDRTDEGLTGSAVTDEHLTEMLATIYATSDGITYTALIEGMLQAHEIGCEARAHEMRRLREALPAELDAALDLLAYCGLFERTADGVRLTPLGVWAVRQDLLREGHDAPLLSEVASYAELSAAELVEAMLSGEAPSSAPTLWVERRLAEDAARELIKVASSGTPGQRGVIGTVLEEMGPEAEPAVREALAEPAMWRHAAVWLGVRELPAPALTEEDGTWLAVDTLATLLHIPDAREAMGEFEALEAGEELLRLVEDISRSTHPDAIAVLELLGAHHPEAAVAKAARKAAMKARSR
ncbi:hypothetical protein Sme01_61130 [Sphaerisporangium melleum]|uniref:Uncharacterized protein n=1 Tax=Sphaerisporangium melleum TaxID=321316 RepID=A0A917RAF0_9ACTN|nr:hypothetical protein [Sphaerisporangium melleum]GGK97540.1 hypothetical protein GCM10007964_44750 [Sphaerisporangium melleum]GII73637.1 hypothetical protein Sme01_61130 [Sphaerisporangium melleum]